MHMNTIKLCKNVMLHLIGFLNNKGAPNQSNFAARNYVLSRLLRKIHFKYFSDMKVLIP